MSKKQAKRISPIVHTVTARYDTLVSAMRAYDADPTDKNACALIMARATYRIFLARLSRVSRAY